MRQAILAILLTVSALALSACFASDEPLIDEATSVAPLAPGDYVASETKPAKGDKPNNIRVSNDGNTTVLTSLDKSDDKPDKVLMRKVQGDYYVMLDTGDNSYMYMLVKVDDAGMLMYDFTDDCKTLEGIAAAKKVEISAYGVVRVDKGSESDTCYFKRFEDLVGAFKAIIDAGPGEPVSVLKRAS